MQVTVLVEKLRANKYRAITSQPVPMESEGASANEALERLYELARKRLAAGQVFQINLPDTPATNPWQTFAGVWKDHPDLDAFVKNVAKYRRSANRPRSSS